MIACDISKERQQNGFADLLRRRILVMKTAKTFTIASALTRRFVPAIALIGQLLSLWLCLSSAYGQSITNPIAALNNHISGVATLTPAQIVTQGNLIQTNILQVGTNAVALAAALDLVSNYDATIGALFTTTATKNGFTRDGSGNELAQALFDLQQGILDNSYSSANLVSYFSVLNGKKFGTSTYFPGAVAPPASTNTGYAVPINASVLTDWGSPASYQTTATRRPTGCYLAPGSMGYVTVPAALVNNGFSIRVGAHYWDLTAKTTVKRLDRVSKVYSITSATTLIANPLGGGIYIEVPYGKNLGIVTVGITNVVRSPLFSATSFHQTTAAEWLTERTNAGPWADFESDKFMMQVPRSWIYNYTGAVKVMQDWDSAMDAVSDLMGRHRIRSKTVLYLQADVDYRGTANFPGYPQSNYPYNPNTVESGNKNHFLLTGPQDSDWTVLHELGHAELFTKFTGEVESVVNLNYVAVQNQKFGIPLEAAFGRSVGGSSTATANDSINLAQAALTWIMTDAFRAGSSMSGVQMQYQHRGHGKYVEIADMFGWGALSNFWYSVNVDYTNGIDYPENTDPTDSRILRISKAAGEDLRPLIHFWGVLPVSPDTLKTNIQNAGLKPSALIYDRIKYYQSLVPTNLAQFAAHYQATKAVVDPPCVDGPWYTNMLIYFTPDIGYSTISNVQKILDLYFPGGRPTTDSVHIASPSYVGVTLADTNTTLRVTAVATSGDSNIVPVITWSEVSGPGVVTFGNVTSADTTARFSVPGSYVLQCQAVTPNSTNTDQVTVAVNTSLTVTYREGVNGYAHIGTFLRGDSTAWNSGARDQFLVGRNGSGQRPVFSFNLPGLDTNVIVQSATLDLWTYHFGGAVGTIGALELRQLNSTPTEGTGDGSTATSGAYTGATWLSRNGCAGTGNAWTSAGGDFGASVLSSVPGYDATVVNQQKTFTSTAGFVAAAQAALNANGPLNLLIISPTTEAGANNYYSRISSDDGSEVNRRPLLTLTYSGHRAPTISGSPVAFATIGVSVPLLVSVTNATGLMWTKVGGPGSAIFGDPTQAATTVMFGVAGNQVLRLTAWNAYGEVSRDFPVQSVANVLPGIGHYESRITFNGYSRAETLTNFPALVLLGPNVFAFDYGTFRAANGGDLRFLSSDGATELNYEVEKWNPAGNSAVWVQVPRFTNGCSVIARWGSGSTNPPAYTTNGATWSSSYVGVWHVNSTTVTDSTAIPQNATANTATPTNGIIGGGLNFDGIAQTVTVPHDSELNLATNFEVQCWFKVNPSDKPAAGNYATLTGKEQAFTSTNRNWWVALQSNGTLIWKSSPAIAVATLSDVADGQWHLVAAVYDGIVARLYVDGAEAAAQSISGAASTQSSSVYFGAEAGTSRFHKGLLDELRCSNVRRSSNWVWAVYQNIASNSTFTTYGNVAATPAATPTFSAGSMASGKMSFQINGDARFSYTVQGSTNLAVWTDLFTTNPPAMPFTWTDDSTTNFASRFYRVLLGL